MTEVELATELVVTEKVAEEAPAETVTLAGTCAAAVLLLDRVTVAPPAGAAPLRVTVPVAELPPFTVAGFTATDDKDEAEGLEMVAVVWALFLYWSARAPLANRLFLDFNLTANSAHFSAMLVMAVAMRDQHQHLAGVLALGLITTVPLAACWLPVRRRARS